MRIFKVGTPNTEGYVTIRVHKDNLPALHVMAERAWRAEATGLETDTQRRVYALALHMMEELIIPKKA